MPPLFQLRSRFLLLLLLQHFGIWVSSDSLLRVYNNCRRSLIINAEISFYSFFFILWIGSLDDHEYSWPTVWMQPSSKTEIEKTRSFLLSISRIVKSKPSIWPGKSCNFLSFFSSWLTDWLGLLVGWDDPISLAKSFILRLSSQVYNQLSLFRPFFYFSVSIMAHRMKNFRPFGTHLFWSGVHKNFQEI